MLRAPVPDADGWADLDANRRFVAATPRAVAVVCSRATGIDDYGGRKAHRAAAPNDPGSDGRGRGSSVLGFAELDASKAEDRQRWLGAFNTAVQAHDQLDSDHSKFVTAPSDHELLQKRLFIGDNDKAVATVSKDGEVGNVVQLSGEDPELRHDAWPGAREAPVTNFAQDEQELIFISPKLAQT
jgi:hypothetical protein